jgi:hypothetical protein
MKMHDQHSTAAEIAAGVTKSAPAVAASTWIWFGLPLERWLQVLTIIWLCLQIGGWVFDRYKRWKEDR